MADEYDPSEDDLGFMDAIAAGDFEPDTFECDSNSSPRQAAGALADRLPADSPFRAAVRDWADEAQRYMTRAERVAPRRQRRPLIQRRSRSRSSHARRAGHRRTTGTRGSPSSGDPEPGDPASTTDRIGGAS